ncbi:MAG: alpha/beta hydrolase [Clostridia bacterium]|nr:alpha/beta hydrolase [Clostridia bacterium]
MKLFGIFSFCLAILFLIFLIFSLILFRRANRRRTHYPADRREHGGSFPLPSEGQVLLRDNRLWFDRQVFESIRILSSDGLRLAGQFLPSQSPARGIVLCFHGYHSSCRRDFTVHTRILHEAGYHVLLADQRSHGQSEGIYICFGAKERWDVGAWCRWAEERFPSLSIALLGLSMGASTVLMATGTPLPSSVQGVVADCGFSSPFEIIARTLRYKHKIYPYPAIYGMNIWSRILAGFDYWQVSCQQALQGNRLPILMIHGENDRFVPTEMSRRISRLFPDQICLWTVPEAPHSQSIYYDPDGYRSQLLSFLDTVMKQK